GAGPDRPRCVESPGGPNPQHHREDRRDLCRAHIHQDRRVGSRDGDSLRHAARAPRHARTARFVGRTPDYSRPDAGSRAGMESTEQFFEGLVARDFGRMRAVFADGAQARFLLPKGLEEHSGADAITQRVESWFGAAAEFELTST